MKLIVNHSNVSLNAVVAFWSLQIGYAQMCKLGRLKTGLQLVFLM